MRNVPFFILFFIAIILVGWFAFILGFGNIQVLNPAGLIASEEKNLIVIVMSLLLVVAITVFLIGLFVAWKFQAKHNNSHKPDWTGSKFVVLGYWAFFGAICIFLFGVVWVSAHRLDPYVPIASSTKPIEIQVVALDWKWLFIYPQLGIATVNFIQVPVNTPVNFSLTADGPMNSFWIPQLSGQIYSMATMETKLHIIANKTGDFPGGAAEINGKGFSGMRFIVRSGSKSDFDKWVEGVKSSSNVLNERTFEKLNKPSENVPVTYYSSIDDSLYNSIVMKYMAPTPTGSMFGSSQMKMEELK